MRHYSYYQRQPLPTITKDEIKQALTEKASDATDFKILDVRNGYEVEATGLLPNAIHIPLPELALICTTPDRLSELDEFIDKDDRIVVYCKSGVRSDVAGQLLKGAGYDDVRNYVGSADEWFDSTEEVFTRLQRVVKTLCATPVYSFVRTMELFDSGNKKHPGEFEFLMVSDEQSPLGGVTNLALELSEAVKGEFGGEMSAEVVPKQVLLELAKKSLDDNEYVSNCLANARLIYPDDRQ